MTERFRHQPITTAPYSWPIKQKFGDEGILKLPVPSVAADYNNLMNGVDISDQYQSNNTSDHQQRQGPARALAWSFLLITAIANSFLLQKLGQLAWKPYKAQSQWQQRLIDYIFNTYGKTGSSRQLFRPGDEITPAQHHHLVNRGKISCCQACQGVQIGACNRTSQQRLKKRAALSEASDDSVNHGSRKRKQTRYGCDHCNVAIYNNQKCWDFYHKQKMPVLEVTKFY